MKYDVIVRTQNGYLAYEFRITLEAMTTKGLDNHNLYQSVINDNRYTVALKPVISSFDMLAFNNA